MSMKNSNDTIGQSCDLPVYSAMPQPLCHCVPRTPDAHNKKKEKGLGQTYG
jgi:hypothetical protein